MWFSCVGMPYLMSSKSKATVFMVCSFIDALGPIQTYDCALFTTQKLNQYFPCSLIKKTALKNTLLKVALIPPLLWQFTCASYRPIAVFYQRHHCGQRAR